jgi:hypothetical protein
MHGNLHEIGVESTTAVRAHSCNLINSAALAYHCNFQSPDANVISRALALVVGQINLAPLEVVRRNF